MKKNTATIDPVTASHRLPVLLLLLISMTACQASAPNIQSQLTNNQTNMRIESPDFENNALIPDEFTCMGKDISPELHISGIPEHTTSLALIMEDPDAPSGTWTHWVVWNISPDLAVIPRNVGLNFARQGLNSWPKKGYGGPCPPSGTHRYFFKLYALTKELDLPENATADDLRQAMENLIIEQDQYMGICRKK